MSESVKTEHPQPAPPDVAETEPPSVCPECGRPDSECEARPCYKPHPLRGHDAEPRLNNEKRLRIFGPHDNPDEPTCYFGEADGDLSALVAQLREYLPQMTERERFVIKVRSMTDAEVEALPDL